MKVFISYARPDRPFAQQLGEALRKEGIDVWMDAFELQVGDNIFAKINEGLKESDYIISVLSPAFNESQWVQKEYQAFAVREVGQGRALILPVLLEDTEIPTFLKDRMYADFRLSFESGLESLLSVLKREASPQPNIADAPRLTRERRESTIDLQVRKIREQYAAGRLCLFCGAGVSVGAGIPTWSNLLRSLLANLFHRVSDSDASETLALADLYQDYFAPSPLMVAQYLKNGLGTDFVKYVRDALYAPEPTSSDLIDAIVELCRPQRSRHSLHSIVTFNFDDLIEANLKLNHINHAPIFKEGQRHKAIELPVFHVHGFLPRGQDLTPAHTVVFSEDAYHDQFLDPFSWSNLTQLNHLNQNLCLLVGLSLTDPNLRRLLDVSMRKNPERTLNHYVFKKTYDVAKIASQKRTKALADISEDAIQDFVKSAQLLEEQDANNLGLHVIWIEEYSEISRVLRRIAEEAI